MQSLIAGYKRFRRDVYPQQRSHFHLLASSQRPHTLFITCSDSRVVPDMITQTEPGELFICRVVGNLVPAHGSSAGGVTSAIEYAVAVLKVRQIVVCGHSDCGAMRAFLHPEKLGGLPAVKAWLEHASTAIAISRQMHGSLPDEAFIGRLIEENIVSQLQHLRTHPVVATALRQGTLKIYGWLYDIAEGTVSVCDEANNEFRSLDTGLLVVDAQREPVAVA